MNLFIIIIGAGDWGQLPPVHEKHINFENSWIVKSVLNYKLYKLVEVKRTNGKDLLRDTRAIRNGEAIDYSTYGTCKHPTALCYSNDAVNAFNSKWNEHYAKQHSRTKTINGFDGTKCILYDELKMLSYKMHGQRISKFSPQYIVQSWTDDSITLKQTQVTHAGRTIDIDIKYSVSFKPGYAMTVHNSHCLTVLESYSICEHENVRNKMLYVALTRATKKSHINFCNIKKYRHHTGHTYIY